MIKILPSKKPAWGFLPYLGAIGYVAIMVCIILSLVKVNFIFLIPPVCIMIALAICSRSFSWYLSAKVEKKGSCIEYSYMSILDMMGNSSIVDTIESVDSYIRRGKNLIVKGHIKHKEPLQKAKTLKKVIILDAPVEVEALIKEVFNK